MNSMTVVVVIVTGAVLLSLLGIGAAWQHNPRAASALIAATGTALLPVLALVPTLPLRLRLALVASPLLVVPAVAAVAVLWAGRGRRLLVISFGLAAAAAVIYFLGYDPFEHPSCRQPCVQVPAVLAPIADTRTATSIATVLVLLAAGVAAVAVARTVRSRLLRAAGLNALLLLAILSGFRWHDFTALEPQPSAWPWEPAAVALVGLAAALLHRRIVRVRQAVGRLVDGLSPDAVIGGPVVDVQFAVDDRWLDRTGADARDEPPAQRSVVLYDGPAPMARLVLGSRVERAEVLAGLEPAAMLALRNAQLALVAQERLTEVRASQRRAVAASDGERRRIERDLHDGAQQRLVGAGFQLRVAQAELAEADPALRRIAAAESKVREALAELRRLAHGIFPGVLVDEGLEPALADLMAASDVPSELKWELTTEVAPDVAMAADAMVAAVLGSVVEPTARTRVGIAVGQENGMLTVRVDLDRDKAVVRRTDLVPIADRIGAVGGELVAEDDDHLRAVIPCG
jgi:MYXO-CTERM domain-containing protein